MDPVRVGVVGCGAISGIYLENSKKFDAFDIIACSDLRLEAAQARAEEYDIPKAYTTDDLLEDPDVELAINLTPHLAHGPVGIQILEAGKNLYSEKPFAVYMEDARRMIDLAERKGLRIGCAPDTFFGGAWQTARKLIDEGVIGKPVAAFSNLHARIAPRPTPPNQKGTGEYVSFYRRDFFRYGVTWAHDRGPYYLNALIHLLGPVARVTASAQKPWDKRLAMNGELVDVEAPTHVTGIMDFENGAVCQFLMTSDVWGTGLPHIEIYGEDASLRCIDPNWFGGQLYLRKKDSDELIPVENEFGYNDNSRGVGIADMSMGIRNGRPHRASGEMGYHVVDIIQAMHDASKADRHIYLKSTCDQPAPLPEGLEDWTIDA